MTMTELYRLLALVLRQMNYSDKQIKKVLEGIVRKSKEEKHEGD